MENSLKPGRNLSVRVISIMGYANYVVREITLTNVSKLSPYIMHTYSLYVELTWDASYPDTKGVHKELL